MSRHKVEISGVNTANIDVLSSEKMEDLFKKVKEGDLVARDMLVNGNLRLVLSILKKFNKKGENLDDLFQVGCIGLLKAIDNFDLSYGVKFSTYCVPMIEGEVRRYLRDNNTVRISRSIKDLAYKAINYKQEYLLMEGVEPTYLQIADYLGVSEYDVINAFIALKDPISIFEPIYNDGGDTIYLFDQIEDSSFSNRNIDEKMSINKAISDLTDRERYILDQRFIMGKTQMELANELGISQAQISRIEKGIINGLRNDLH